MREIGTLQGVVITLIILGIIVGIGSLVLEEFQSGLSEEVATITNETITPTDTGVYVDYNYTTAGINCYNSFSPVIVTNATDGVVINSGNYSYNSNGEIWNLTNEFPSSWNVTYTYQYGEEACGGVETTIEAAGKIPAWLPIVVILLIVGVIMWLVFKTMPRLSGGRGEGLVAEI